MSNPGVTYLTVAYSDSLIFEIIQERNFFIRILIFTSFNSRQTLSLPICCQEHVKYSAR